MIIFSLYFLSPYFCVLSLVDKVRVCCFQVECSEDFQNIYNAKVIQMNKVG